jgi:hypothetical protein
MLIEQGPPAWAGIISGLINAASQYGKGQRQAKQAEADRKQQAEAAAQALAIQKARLGIDANNAGMVIDPQTGQPKPWTPPAASGGDALAGKFPVGINGPNPANRMGAAQMPAMPQVPPGVQGMLAGLGGAPAAPTAPAQPQVPKGVNPELVHSVAVAQAQVDSLLQVATSERQQAETMQQQGAPRVLVQQHLARAKDATSEAGTWQARLTTAQADVEKATGAAQKTNADKFVRNEHPLPGDPSARLKVLMKRLQIERGIPGLDTKPTQQMIADTQRELSESALERHRSAQEQQAEQRFGLMLDRFARASNKAPDNGDSPAARTVWANVTKAKTPQDAARIIGDPSNGLTIRDRSSMLAIVKDMNPGKPPADTSGLDAAGKELFNRDMEAWKANGKDPDEVPDPSNPKYEKRSSSHSAPSLPPTKVNPANGKTYYLHAADGKYYLTP